MPPCNASFGLIIICCLPKQTELINHKERLLGLTWYFQTCSRAKHHYLKSPRQSDFSVTGSRAQVACISPTPHLF